MTGLEHLAVVLDDDNEASIALVIRCILAKRFDLADRAAEVAVSVRFHGNRVAKADVEYRAVFKELNDAKECEGPYIWPPGQERKTVTYDRRANYHHEASLGCFCDDCGSPC